MISIIQLPDNSSISGMKADYLRGLTAPMDGMWDTGFTNPAPHWELRIDGQAIGYVAVSDEGVLLQFYVEPGFIQQAGSLLDHAISELNVSTAMVSTIDPAFLSLCFDRNFKMTVNTYLYEIYEMVAPKHPEADSVLLRLITAEELKRVTDMQNYCLGGSPGENEWLQGYSSNLIARNEIYVMSQGDEWLGLGECRRSDTQSGVADLGVMVDPSFRGNGWATFILSSLIKVCADTGLKAICSTATENPASQKAIERAGFRTRNRILDVSITR